MASICLLSSVHQALDGRIFYREARSLARAGHAVSVAAIHPRDEIVDGVRILGLPALPRVRRPLLWRRLLQRALEARADVYHIHDPELLLPAPLLRRRTGRPLIYDVHESNADFIAMKAARFGALQGAARQSAALLEPQLAQACAGIIAADEQIGATFAGLNVPQSVLYNYPTQEFIQQADSMLTTVNDAAARPPVVLHLGTHTVARGVLLMLAAFAQVHAALPAAQLLLVGPFHPPELKAHVQAEAARLGLAEAITLTGRLPFAEVGRHLQAAAVGWIPLQATPKYEKNIPTKLFEYMAYGLPVVSSDLTPVRPYLIDGAAGLLAAPARPEAHAAMLLALLRNPARAGAMGQAGRQLVKTRYNWSHMETHLLGLYDEVLASVKRRP